MNGKVCEYKKTTDDEELLGYTKEIIREVALAEGAPEEDIQDIAVILFSTYNVVRGWRITARITDIILGIAPGITQELL